MLDIKYIKENLDTVKERLCARGPDYGPELDRLIALDTERRDIITRVEAMKAEQNAQSKKVPELKKVGQDTAAVFERMKQLAGEVKELDARLREVEAELSAGLLGIPNVPDRRVPVGKDADDNVEVRRWGEVRDFGFEPKPHWEIGEALGILDPSTAAKVTGARFHFYRGLGARLERAVISLYLDIHSNKNGYTEIFPPFLVNRASMTGTGQLPKFEEDAFKIEGTDYFLIPTAEVPVTNMHRDEILDASALPIKYCAYSACFRAEAGSAGRDTRGLIRQHQFNKVELVKFTDEESSFDELETLTRDAESVLQAIGLPYRVVLLCTGDMGFGSSMTYDIEAYMPSYGRYVEISSCSNYVGYQARRAKIRYRGEDGKPRTAHTLNGSGVAVGRTVATILEYFQNPDGSVTVPEVLRPFMGVDRIG